jgi:hypothetical protein
VTRKVVTKALKKREPKHFCDEKSWAKEEFTGLPPEIPGILFKPEAIVQGNNVKT